MTGISTRSGLVYYLFPDTKLPRGPGIPPKVFPFKYPNPRSVPVILVHGFGYDPWREGRNNPHHAGPLGDFSIYRYWQAYLTGQRPTVDLGWYSVPSGLCGLSAAWINGYRNHYRYAWDLAAEAGRVLATMIQRLGEVDILCHSLGSRVVLAALRQERYLPVRNVVMLNAAELTKTGYVTALANDRVRFFNLVVHADDVLGVFGSLFAPSGSIYATTLGQHGLHCDDVLTFQAEVLPENWCDIDLDSPKTQAWGRSQGWTLGGDNPNAIGDHWYSWKNPGNHAMLQRALGADDGDWLFFKEQK